MLKIKIRNRPALGERWRHCELCGANARLHPECDMAEYEGKWYCKPHFDFRFKMDFKDEVEIDIEDEE